MRLGACLLAIGGLWRLPKFNDSIVLQGCKRRHKLTAAFDKRGLCFCIQEEAGDFSLEGFEDMVPSPLLACILNCQP